jgi:RNA polymerase sigma-70 factor, ECF subfamily
MDRQARGQVGEMVRSRPSPNERPMPSRPSFQDVFQAHSQYVWVTLRRLGARPAELEDLTHDVFIQVLRHLDEYDPERPMRPWLFAFAFRVAAEDRRRVRRRPEVAADLGQAPDFKPGPVEELLQQERRELARAAFDEVGHNRRAVFILHELDGFAIPEVAKSLAIPLATAYSRLRLAREDFALITRRLRTRQR